MPRRQITFTANNFYHLYSRGDRREPIFRDSNDYLRLLRKLEEYRQKYSFDLIAYCLIPNHLHFLAKQLTAVSVSKFLGVLLNSYARYFGLKYELPTGHLFQGRFGAKLIESEGDLLQVSRYIHLNPVKEKLLGLDFTYKTPRKIKDRAVLKQLRDYRWSSYPFYSGQAVQSEVRVNPDTIIEIEKDLKKYQKFVESKLTDQDLLTLEGL